MPNSKFITVPKIFQVSVDETDGNFLLSLNDKSVILKIDKKNVNKEGSKYLLRVGTAVTYVKGSKSANRDKREEIEIYEDCPGSQNKKYCQNGITLCCEPPHVIVGTCEGEWSDC